MLTLAVGALVHQTLGLRATSEAELADIDEYQHAETAYDHGRFGAYQTAIAAPGGQAEGEARPPAV